MHINRITFFLCLFLKAENQREIRQLLVVDKKN
jgi:hypothetical protein